MSGFSAAGRDVSGEIRKCLLLQAVETMAPRR
jgi:hypothetical protein